MDEEVENLTQNMTDDEVKAARDWLEGIRTEAPPGLDEMLYELEEMLDTIWYYRTEGASK